MATNQLIEAYRSAVADVEAEGGADRVRMFMRILSKVKEVMRDLPLRKKDLPSRDASGTYDFEMYKRYYVRLKKTFLNGRSRSLNGSRYRKLIAAQKQILSQDEITVKCKGDLLLLVQLKKEMEHARSLVDNDVRNEEYEWGIEIVMDPASKSAGRKIEIFAARKNIVIKS